MERLTVNSSLEELAESAECIEGYWYTGRSIVVFDHVPPDETEFLEWVGQRASGAGSTSALSSNSDLVKFCKKLGFALVAVQAEQLAPLNGEGLPWRTLPESFLGRSLPEPVPWYRRPLRFLRRSLILLLGEPTWGIAKTGVQDSRLAGSGVSIAILDTGVVKHTDLFKLRPPPEGIDLTRSGKAWNESDQTGHGTHCAGIAAGPLLKERRYGVAGSARLLIAKVVADTTVKIGDGNYSSAEGIFLQGICWALSKGADVISISLDYSSDAPPKCKEREELFRRVAERALVVAAAGASAARSNGSVGFVGYPACLPSVMAVGSMAKNGGIWESSPRGTAAAPIDLVAPGEEIISCGLALGYPEYDGTSTSAPFVAGIAALYLEAYRAANPPITPKDLWKLLKDRADPSTLAKLPGLTKEDYGEGLVKAPSPVL